MFFMGNPGDYAWGREGLDTVITQMLNQMENSGPPPLAKEKIQDIPRIEITDDQVNQKLQCSVCWDDFERMETVRKLPCTVSNGNKTSLWSASFKWKSLCVCSTYTMKIASFHGLNCTERAQFAERLLIKIRLKNNKIKCLV